jgi:E3 ubiquitin-protein ligase NRDP1
MNCTYIYLCRLCISCDNAQYGCEAVLKLDSLPAHLEECEHNPKRPVPCEQGCGHVIPMDELKVRFSLQH